MRRGFREARLAVAGAGPKHRQGGEEEGEGEEAEAGFGQPEADRVFREHHMQFQAPGVNVEHAVGGAIPRRPDGRGGNA